MAITDITKPMALDETLQGTNTKMDAVILKLQGIIDALGLDTSVYKPKGNITCAALVPALLIDDNLGNVYNVTDNGTTTSDFVEGAGKPIHVGDNVAIVDIGTGGQSEYKFDLLAGMVDLTNYIQKSNTSGLVKNDGTIDTKDYAEKVAGATSGNLAGLDGNGNLTDSGWNGAKDTTSISDNPISISGLKANQLAINPIITLEPIQAGSGTPSPSNIRAISGYDKVEVLSCGKNLFDKDSITANSWLSTTTGLVESANASYCVSDYIMVKANQPVVIPSTQTSRRWFYDKYKNPKTYLNNDGLQVFTPTEDGYIRVTINLQYISLDTVQIEFGSSATTYVPYNKTTSISESLGQTVYGATWYPRTGELVVDRKKIDLANQAWQSYAGMYYINMTDSIPSQGEGHIIAERYKPQIDNTDDNTISINWQNVLFVKCSGETPQGNAVYELATPFTIQLTPHEISLLKDYAYVSTNGTTIALDYHNGELASLADVSQLGETVNELGDKVSVKFKIVTDTTSIVGNFDPAISNDYVIVGVESLSAQYIGIPFKNDGGNWRCRFLDTTNIAYIKNTSITAKIYYI